MVTQAHKQEVQSTSEQETQRDERLSENGETMRDCAYVLLNLEHPTYQNVQNALTRYLEDSAAYKEVVATSTAEHKARYDAWIAAQLAEQHQRLLQGGYLEGECEKPDDLICVRCDNYPPILVNGKPCLQTAFLGSDGELQRTSLHVSFNHTVAPIAALAGGASWTESKYVYIFPYIEAKELNGSMYGFKPEDGWWALGTEPFILPEGTIVLTQKASEAAKIVNRIPALSSVEVEGKPYDAAEQVMNEMQLPVKEPKDFQNPRKFADQEGLFYGFHLGNASGYGSQGYIRAEAVIDKYTKKLEITQKIVEAFNEFNGQFPEWTAYVRRAQLINLAAEVPEYFNAQDYCPSFKAGAEPFEFSEVVYALVAHYYGGKRLGTLADSGNAREDRLAKLAWEFYRQLGLRSEDPNFTLDPFSENLMESITNDMRNKLETLPPQIIGTFIMRNQSRFSAKIEQ